MSVVVRFGILERISIRSYVFATVGTVERPFPAKTYHYLICGCMATSISLFQREEKNPSSDSPPIARQST
jgi:hypothetical protein